MTGTPAMDSTGDNPPVRSSRAARTSRALRDTMVASQEATQELARRLGVGVSDAAALDHLMTSPTGLGAGELAVRLGIRSASATVLVDRLEAAGHVRRAPHPTDRRRIVVAPTAHAVDEVLAALRPLLDLIEAAAAELSDAEAEATQRFLAAVATAMRDYAQPH